MRGLEVIIAIIVVIGILVSIFVYLNLDAETDIDGITFNIPIDYGLSDSGENENSFYKRYTDEFGAIIQIYVYKTKSLEEVLSDFRSTESQKNGWNIDQNISFGNYSGVQVNWRGSPYFFIFEKDGRTVAIHAGGESLSSGGGFVSDMERILK